MKALLAALALTAATFGTAGAAGPPTSTEATIDVTLGQCLSEKTGEPRRPGSINVKLVGISAVGAPTNGQLSREALRVPTADGYVYYDPSADYCYVRALDVDPAPLAAAVIDAVLKSDKRWSKAHDGPPDANSPNVRLVVLVRSDAKDAPTPVIIVLYSKTGERALTTGVVMAQPAR